MVIAFLGKGGSGKSTLAARAAQALAKGGATVLAVDADHNMDLRFNLGGPEKMPYVGQSMPDLRKAIGLAPDQNYREAFFLPEAPQFRLSPPDAFTAGYSAKLPSGIRLMVAGPHTNDILYDKSCSHVLTTPLKVYLPFLQLQKSEYAVVDEKAGADGVGTGVATGFDVAMVVAEPTPHGLKAAEQLAGLLEFYGTPYAFVLNKVRSDAEAEAAAKSLRMPPVAVFRFEESLSRPEGESAAAETEMAILLAFAEAAAAESKSRRERTAEKLERNQVFAERKLPPPKG